MPSAAASPGARAGGVGGGGGRAAAASLRGRRRRSRSDGSGKPKEPEGRGGGAGPSVLHSASAAAAATDTVAAAAAAVQLASGDPAASARKALFSALKAQAEAVAAQKEDCLMAGELAVRFMRVRDKLEALKKQNTSDMAKVGAEIRRSVGGDGGGGAQ